MYGPNDDNSYSPPGQDGPHSEAEDTGSEYRLRGSDIRQYEYKEADYIPADSAPSMTNRGGYHYSEPEKPPKEPRERRKRSFGFGRVLAMCLVCAIIGGVAGGMAGGYRAEQLQDALPASVSVTDSVTEAPVQTANPQVTPSGLAASGDLSGTEIYSLGCPQTVGIQSEITTQNFFGQQSANAITGSGFIVGSDGYIVTNYHVIETALYYNVDITVMLYNGDTYKADVVGYDKDNDVALLKIDATGLPAVTLGDSDSIQVGETLYTIGNPLGELSYTMTTGCVSALNREITTDSSSNSITMFQFDAAVNSGNSGGPVFNGKGEVIGIVTAKTASTGVEGLGFAIPINDAMSIVNDLIEKGYVTGKPSLGITVQTVPDSIIEYYNLVKGAYVFAITENGAAARAGIRQGDIITKLNDTDILSNEDLSAAKDGFTAGDTVKLTVYRSGEYLEFDVTFDEDNNSQNQQQQQQQQPDYR